MAEILGAIASGITLAALFKTCVEAFDLIQTCRQQEVEYRKLKLRLNIEKCRLYIWGESMGLVDAADKTKQRPIDKLRFPKVVREILEELHQLFQDSSKIKDKYGCRRATSQDLFLDTQQSGPLNNLAASFSNFSIHVPDVSQKARKLQKVSWVIQDRKKFALLVKEIKDLIDSLQGITSTSASVPKQDGTMKRKLVGINDIETLSLIAEVCSEDHPDLADAVSTKADTISVVSTYYQRIAHWADNIQEIQPPVQIAERTVPDLESLTVTDLKHQVFQLMKELDEHKASLATFNPSSQLKTEATSSATSTSTSNLFSDNSQGSAPASPEYLGYAFSQPTTTTFVGSTFYPAPISSIPWNYHPGQFVSSMYQVPPMMTLQRGSSSGYGPMNGYYSPQAAFSMPTIGNVAPHNFYNMPAQYDPASANHFPPSPSMSPPSTSAGFQAEQTSQGTSSAFAGHKSHLPFQMTPQELQLQAQHQQHLLHDQLFEQYQVLQLQEQELRMQLYTQSLRRRTLPPPNQEPKITPVDDDEYKKAFPELPRPQSADTLRRAAPKPSETKSDRVYADVLLDP